MYETFKNKKLSKQCWKVAPVTLDSREKADEQTSQPCLPSSDCGWLPVLTLGTTVTWKQHEPSSRLHDTQCESDLYKACNSHCTCGRKQVPLTLDRNTGMCVKGVMQWLKIVISGKHGKQIKGSESADILHSLATAQWAPGRKRGRQSTDTEAGWKEAVRVKALLSWRQMGRPWGDVTFQPCL